MTAHPTLTSALAVTLSFYQSFTATHLRPPTLAEAGKALGVTPQGVSLRCRHLERLGYLDRLAVPKAPRGLYTPSQRIKT